LIREADPDDAAALAPLLTALGYPAEPEDVARRLAALAGAPADGVWVCELDGAIAGVASAHASPLLTSDFGVCRITAIVVADAARGQGAGRALADRVEAQARQWDCDRIEVTSAERRTDAHAFYRRLGFEVRPHRFIKELPVV
jgi:GNAT superfamily N-acetyltransferase